MKSNALTRPIGSPRRALGSSGRCTFSDEGVIYNNLTQVERVWPTNAERRQRFSSESGYAVITVAVRAEDASTQPKRTSGVEPFLKLLLVIDFGRTGLRNVGVSQH